MEKLPFTDVLVKCHVHINIAISPSDAVKKKKKKEIHHFVYLFICNFALLSIRRLNANLPHKYKPGVDEA